MDETALLAAGVLLEESAKASLGNTGDMVFVEAEEYDRSSLLGRKPPDRPSEIGSLENVAQGQDGPSRKRRRHRQGSSAGHMAMQDMPHR